MFNLVFSALLFTSAHATDPRLEIRSVRKCVDEVKRFLRSEDYTGQENEQKIIGACRNASADCVAEVGESLRPSKDLEASDFLMLVRMCRGGGMAKCFQSIKDTVPSYDRREVSQIKALLKKCE